ncbi:MAG: hypothetical protein A3I05_08130 [Deltaproteobacteria bacterium RIFCSPLOWO2_02_FULL_44_10]|nr:MAG: hypothetical protein A3C46_05010 [Deltaproteobacteria bacterium RIFCSPHIGHO2_02_FULL_44_16]OGQ45929.1 MAG: hypothetical protein A3I05_08130 [Deltaproteobacteria bacterium RIFCSPLOWO2_02_FULL_44_10]
MPCNDVTDSLKLTLDEHDHILSYELSKRTCGAEVGELSLISDWIKEKKISEILSTPAEHFLEEYLPPKDDIEEFLFLKHFFSIQNGLRSLLGDVSATNQDVCTVDGVEQDGNLTHLMASLKVDLITKEIKSCAGCACTKKRDERRAKRGF